MQTNTIEQFLNNYKKVVTPEVVIDFLTDYFEIETSSHFCDEFVAEPFDEDNTMSITVLLHGQFFTDNVIISPFDIKTSLASNRKIIIAWRKYLNSLIPNYKQAYKQYFLQKQEQKIDEELLEF